MELCDQNNTHFVLRIRVWWFHGAPDIERVHLKFCKTVLGVKATVQNDCIYGELNRLPLKDS